jgi:hypothetical protein
MVFPYIEVLCAAGSEGASADGGDDVDYADVTGAGLTNRVMNGSPFWW